MSEAAGAETELLISYLGAQRRHVLGALDGLDEATLRSAALPTGWTFLGLVQHLALDVERVWLRAVVAAEPDAIETALHSGDAAWTVGDDVPVADVLASYRSEAERADEILRRTSLDAPPAW